MRLLVDGRDVAPLQLAESYPSRLRGLLGRRQVDGALLLRPSSSVHGVGMVISLDVALLSGDLRVLHVAVLPPFGLVLPRRGVRAVLEARRGAFTEWGLRPGSQLQIDGPAPRSA